MAGAADRGVPPEAPTVGATEVATRAAAAVPARVSETGLRFMGHPWSRRRSAGVAAVLDARPARRTAASRASGNRVVRLGGASRTGPAGRTTRHSGAVDGADHGLQRGRDD